MGYEFESVPESLEHFSVDSEPFNMFLILPSP